MTLKEFLLNNKGKKLSASVEELSKNTGISSRNIYRILAGTIDPRYSTVRKISDATGLATDKIIAA